MSKVYTINGGKLSSDQIPSIDYINELIRIIENELINRDSKFKGFTCIKHNVEELPIGVKVMPEILASEVKTDSAHKFVTDAIIATMVDKPTKFEMNESIDKAKDEMKDDIYKTYMKIINTPNVINKLRDISIILNEDKIADGLLNAIASKNNIEDFAKHKKSHVHMNNNDRKALNVLLKCLTNGFSDWNADDNAYNAIKNKPTSLPADGGNADTIANHGIQDIINKNDYDLVIGRTGQKYSKDSCDIYAQNGNIDMESFNDTGITKNGGTVLFKRGDYTIDYIINSNAIIFKGIDHRFTSITIDINADITNAVIKDITFKDSIINIYSDCDIDNVSFINCKINFIRSTGCNISNCRFNKCNFQYEGSLMNNIIKFNRYINTKSIKYIGGNNIITENI